MVRTRFQESIETLDNHVRSMGEALLEALEDTKEVLKGFDIRKAHEIIKRDDWFDLMERQVESECIRIIQKEAPLAKDLRKITAYMRLISDMERIADHCEDISEYIVTDAALRRGDLEKMRPKLLFPMYEQMEKMMAIVIDAFLARDAESAKGVLQMDEVVDHYFHEIKRMLAEAIQENPAEAELGLSYLMVVKYIERMADHATNVAEWIVYLVTGDLILGEASERRDKKDEAEETEEAEEK